MEKFDLKTAMPLLPVMTHDEDVTKQLISNIEMYSSMLDGPGKAMLVTFVLKSRLSETAKLRMRQNYSSVTDLVADMKRLLLTKKSDTALQQQLQQAKQGGKTIEEFGRSIETMFTDLTISQADGDVRKYEVLKPINERNAIKRFSDGLKNTRISTIVTARNYSSLKEAIRGAMDEELSLKPEKDGKNQRGRGSTQNWNRGYNPRFSYPRRIAQSARSHIALSVNIAQQQNNDAVQLSNRGYTARGATSSRGHGQTFGSRTQGRGRGNQSDQASIAHKSFNTTHGKPLNKNNEVDGLKGEINSSTRGRGRGGQGHAKRGS